MNRQLALGLVVVALGFVNSGCFLDATGYGGSGGTGGTGGAGGETGTTGGSGGSGGMTTSTGGGGSTGGNGGAGGGNIVCNDGDVQSCYSGLPATKDVGVCKAGQQACANNAWGPCQGEVLPEAMDVTCDGLDTDCDGVDDMAEGCPAFEVALDTCHGVLLLDSSDNIITLGSSPDDAACYNGSIKWLVNPGDKLYILEDDSETTVTIWNIDPMTVNAKAQSNGSNFDHASLLAQYQAGGFNAVGLTQTVTPVPDGNEYQLVRAGSALRQSFLFSF